MGIENLGYSYGLDVWSLGVMIYTVLNSSKPFKNNDIKIPIKKTEKLSNSAYVLLSHIFRYPDERWNLSEIAESLWMEITPIHPLQAPGEVRNLEITPVSDQENQVPIKLEQKPILDGSAPKIPLQNLANFQNLN